MHDWIQDDAAGIGVGETAFAATVGLKHTMARILFIDDEEQIRKTSAALLQSAGHEVVVANDGQEGVELFRRQPFDLVITDVLMPRMGGAETIAALRQLRPEIKILATYGGGQVSWAESVATAQRLGADWLLVKPFTFDELLAAAANVMNGAKAPPDPRGSSPAVE
ncbi:MAG TPA: response regulator [Opitutaceae bacterium]|nr:response regulator [Opitutaceae bacterium]